MNEIDPLEIQLRAWQPRRPSARLRARIFGKRPAAEPRPAFSLSWLAPAAACLLLLLMTFSQRRHELTRLSGLGDQSPVLAMIMSNRSFAAYLPGSYQNEQNALRNTFEWTNTGHSIFLSR